MCVCVQVQCVPVWSDWRCHGTVCLETQLTQHHAWSPMERVTHTHTHTKMCVCLNVSVCQCLWAALHHQFSLFLQYRREVMLWLWNFAPVHFKNWQPGHKNYILAVRGFFRGVWWCCRCQLCEELKRETLHLWCFWTTCCCNKWFPLFRISEISLSLSSAVCLCSSEDSRVRGDSSGSAGVWLLPTAAQGRNRDEGKRTHEDILAAGGERHQVTEEKTQPWTDGGGKNDMSRLKGRFRRTLQHWTERHTDTTSRYLTPPPPRLQLDVDLWLYLSDRI